MKEIQKVKKIKNIPHSKAVKKLGMACSYPGTFNSSIHSILNQKIINLLLSKRSRLEVVIVQE